MHTESPRRALELIAYLDNKGKPDAFQYAFPILHHMKNGNLGSSKNQNILPDHIKYLSNIESYTDGNNRMVCRRLEALFKKVNEHLDQKPEIDVINSMTFLRLCHEVRQEVG